MLISKIFNQSYDLAFNPVTPSLNESSLLSPQWAYNIIVISLCVHDEFYTETIKKIVQYFQSIILNAFHYSHSEYWIAPQLQCSNTSISCWLWLCYHIGHSELKLNKYEACFKVGGFDDKSDTRSILKHCIRFDTCF